jgi:hypothetical protein
VIIHQKKNKTYWELCSHCFKNWWTDK